MTSVLNRKSFRELTRHRIRSLVTIVTIAATVTGLWLFAIPLGLDAAVAQRMEADRHHDIRLSPNNLVYVPDPAAPPPADQVISAAELEASDGVIIPMQCEYYALEGLSALPNIEAVEARPVMRTQMRRGSQTEDIWLVGVEDFARQQVNVVSAEEGELPATSPDDLSALLDAPASQGEQVSIKAGDGKFYPFTVSGSGGTIRWSGRAVDIGEIVYVPAATVRLFTASVGFNSLELRLADTSVEATEATLEEVRSYLDRVAPGMEYWDVPEVSQPGSWYGRDQVFRLHRVGVGTDPRVDDDEHDRVAADGRDRCHEGDRREPEDDHGLLPTVRPVARRHWDRHRHGSRCVHE